MRKNSSRCLKLILIAGLFFMFFPPVGAVNEKIDFGITKTGSISSPGGVDTYTFSGVTGDAIVIRIAKTSGDLWPRITLYGSNGKEIKRAYSTTQTEILVTLTSPGTQKILVDDGYRGSYTGDYSIFVQRINNPDNVKPFEFGVAKSGSFKTPGFVDSFSFSAVTGDAVVIRISKTAGDLWPRITLYGPPGTELKRAYSTTTTEISYPLTSSGTYTILVDDGYRGSYTGDYSLFTQFTAGSASEAVISPVITTISPTVKPPSSVQRTPTGEQPAPTGSTPASDFPVNYMIVIIIAGIIIGVIVISAKKFSGKPKIAGPSRFDPRLPTTSSSEARISGTVNHDVIISYSTFDKPIADAVCAGLEYRGIRCWIAPRDILAGVNYQEGIIDAINTSKIMVLIYSSHANESPHVIREATIAMSKKVIIIPFRLDDAPLSKTMEFIISTPHWLDAITPPLEKHIEELGNTIQILLENERNKRKTV